jgi:hypothetical protein
MEIPASISKSAHAESEFKAWFPSLQVRAYLRMVEILSRIIRIKLWPTS